MRSWACRISLAVVILGGIVLQFLPETVALSWHAIHRQAVVLPGYELQVPLQYFASGNGTAEVSLFRSEGRFQQNYSHHHERALMAFSYKAGLIPAEERQRIAPDEDRLLHRHTELAAELKIAGQPALCFKSVRFVRPEIIWVECNLRGQTVGLDATFFGDPTLVPEFLDTVRTIRKR
jgi:hypothetical protein